MFQHFVAALIVALPPPADVAISGPAAALGGDRLVMEDGRTISLHGVVAPHVAQYCQRSDNQIVHCGRLAQELLEALVSGRTVRCTLASGTSGVCRVGSVDLGEEMLRRGFAFPPRRGASARYEGLAAEARVRRRGLWRGRFLHPEEWIEARGRSPMVRPDR